MQVRRLKGRVAVPSSLGYLVKDNLLTALRLSSSSSAQVLPRGLQVDVFEDLAGWTFGIYGW